MLLENKVEVKNLLSLQKDILKYRLLIQENDSRKNYFIYLISSSIGQIGLQGDDLKKIFSVIDNGSHVSYHKNWAVSNHAGLVIFIEKEMWKFNSDEDMIFGYFNFQETTSCNYLNKWKL